MNRNISKVAVLGSGIMGSGIACHFANIGVEVLLLDIAPKELNDKETKQGLTLSDNIVKNSDVVTITAHFSEHLISAPTISLSGIISPSQSLFKNGLIFIPFSIHLFKITKGSNLMI